MKATVHRNLNRGGWSVNLGAGVQHAEAVALFDVVFRVRRHAA